MIVFYNFNEELFLSTPSARRATFSKYLWGCCVEFLSTPSARRATSRLRPCLRWYSFLSTPSARRATRRSWQGVQLRSISIHALREEGDDKHALVIKLLKIFLSTPSARRATRREVALNVRKKISIHALREEGDNNFINHCTAPFNFYPRPPRGGRHRSWHR